MSYELASVSSGQRLIIKSYQIHSDQINQIRSSKIKLDPIESNHIKLNQLYLTRMANVTDNNHKPERTLVYRLSIKLARFDSGGVLHVLTK